MFDFQRLTVYQKAKAFHLKVSKLIETTPSISRTNKDQILQIGRGAFGGSLGNIGGGSSVEDGKGPGGAGRLFPGAFGAGIKPGASAIAIGAARSGRGRSPGRYRRRARCPAQPGNRPIENLRNSRCGAAVMFELCFCSRAFL